MKPVRTLVRITHGSHLYGTSTPASDQDFKSVHLPSGMSIIHQNANTVINNGVKLSDGPKNAVGDIDDQSFTLQKFLKMISEGDTVATEILFAPDWAIVETSEEWEWIRSISNLLVNKQCKGFVGYCQRQAAKYGIKGSRMAACKDLVDLLAFQFAGPNAKLFEIKSQLEHFCETHEFSSIVDIPTPQGVSVWHLECVDRKVPFTASIKQAYDIYAKVFENYGERTRAAMNNEGIDWKAVSHAVRVARQAIELLSTGMITFPRPDAEELLAIKQGKIDYKIVEALLEGLVEEVEIASKLSYLTDESDASCIADLVTEYYVDQVMD